MSKIQNIKNRLFKLFAKINNLIVAIVLSIVYLIILLPYSLIFKNKTITWYNRQHTYKKKDTHEMW